MQIGGTHPFGQRGQMQRHLDNHALLEIAHTGHKQGPARQASAMHDFRNMFMRQTQRIGFKQRGRAGLISFNHAAPTA